MAGISGKGDNGRPVHFHNFLFDSFQILTYYCFFSTGPTSGPDSASAGELKLTLTCERKREAGVGLEWKGKVK